MNFGFLNREVPSFHAAAIIMGGATLAAKLLGLFRDRLLAAHFGAGDTLDAYYAAFQIPDLLYMIFLVGGASAAVLPVFLSYERRSRLDAERFIGNLLVVLGLLGIILIGAAILLAPWLITLIAPGFSGAKFSLTVLLARYMMSGALFLGIAGILSSVLQANHRFFAFALPAIVYNIGIIIGVVLFLPWLGPKGLAIGVLLGGVLQILVQLPAMRSIQFRFRPSFNLRDAGFRTVVRTSLPRVIALSMSQVTTILLLALASFFTAGSISVFKFASNLLYVPVGLFGVSYALAMFPRLSDASLSGQGEAFREHIVFGVRNILFWAIPIAALAIVLRAHLVRVILGSGAFDWQDTRLVAATFAILAIAIISESLLPLVLRAFYALGNTRSPLFWDIVGSFATITFALGFTLWFTHHPSVLSHIAQLLRIGDLHEPRILAIALGFSLGSLLNLTLLFLSLSRVFRERFSISLLVEFAPVAGMLGASLVAAVAAYVSLLPFPAIISTNTLLGIFAQGFVAGVVGFFVYGGILLLQGNAEIQGLFESFRQHLVSPRKTPQVFDAEKLDGESGK